MCVNGKKYSYSQTNDGFVLTYEAEIRPAELKENHGRVNNTCWDPEHINQRYLPNLGSK